MAEDYTDIRDAVAKLCAQFPGEYWRELDAERAYPAEFVKALTDGGYLSVLIPEEYGGAGMDTPGFPTTSVPRRTRTDRNTRTALPTV